MVMGSVSVFVPCNPSMVHCVLSRVLEDVHFTYQVYIDGLDAVYHNDLSPLYIVFQGSFTCLCIAIAVVEFECIYGQEDCVALFTLIQEVHLLK